MPPSSRDGRRDRRGQRPGRSASPRGRQDRDGASRAAEARASPPVGARAEADDGDEHRRENEVNDQAWPKRVSVSTAAIGSGSISALQSSAIKRTRAQPTNRGDQGHETVDHRDVACCRRQREPEPSGRDPKRCAHAECQHRRQEMGEAERERGHRQSPSTSKAIRTSAARRSWAHGVASHLHALHGPAGRASPRRADPHHAELDLHWAGVPKLSVASTLSPSVERMS